MKNAYDGSVWPSYKSESLAHNRIHTITRSRAYDYLVHSNKNKNLIEINPLRYLKLTTFEQQSINQLSKWAIQNNGQLEDINKNDNDERSSDVCSCEASLCHLSYQNTIISAYCPFLLRSVELYACSVVVKMRYSFASFRMQKKNENEKKNHETFQHAHCMRIFCMCN